MHPGSLLRLWRYINHLLTYLLTLAAVVIIAVINKKANAAHACDRQSDSELYSVNFAVITSDKQTCHSLDVGCTILICVSFIRSAWNR